MVLLWLAARPLKGLVSQRFFKKRTNLYERGKKAKGRPFDGIVRQMLQVVLDLLYLHFQIGNPLVRFIRVELGNALDADFGQTGDVLIGDRADEVFDVGRKPFVDGL